MIDEATPEQVREALSALTLAKISKLIAYASVHGPDPSEYVSEAIELLISGKRKWSTLYKIERRIGYIAVRVAQDEKRGKHQKNRAHVDPIHVGSIAATALEHAIAREVIESGPGMDNLLGSLCVIKKNGGGLGRMLRFFQ